MKRISLLFLTLFLFMIGTNVYATTLVEAGETVIQEGEYDSIRFVAGNNVTNKAAVNGINIIAGNQVTIEGISEYGFFAGNIINVNGSVLKDIFVAGNNITIDPGAELGRDVFIAGSFITVSTNIKRDLRVGGDSVNISGITIDGDAFIDSEKIIMDENTVIKGKLVYLETSNVTGLDKANIGEVSVTKVDMSNVTYSVKDQIISFIRSYLAAVITMILILFALPRAKDKLDNTSLDISKMFKSALLGFATLVIVPIVAIITLFTGILTPASLIIIVFYLVVLYLSQLVGAYVFGNLISKKLFNKETMYLSIFIGILVVRLVDLIPFVGSLVSAFVFLYGMGLIYRFIASRGK